MPNKNILSTKFFLLLATIVVISVVGYVSYLQTVNSSNINIATVESGLIYSKSKFDYIFKDRFGTPLSRNENYLDIYVDFSKISLEQDSKLLSDVSLALNMPKGELEEKYLQAGVSSEFSRKDDVLIASTPVTQIEDNSLFSLEKYGSAVRIKERSLHGYSSNMYHILGYRNQNTATNMERYIDTVIGDPNLKEDVFVKDVTLSLDADLQKVADNVFSNSLFDVYSKKRAYIIYSAKTGDILAMNSFPTIDTDRYFSDQDYARLKNADKDLPMFNRATYGLYPPGSTFKILSAYTALLNGIINESTIISSEGTIKLPDGQPFSEYTRNPYGDLNIYSAIEKSSNIFFCKLFLDRGMSITSLNNAAKDFGLESLTGIEIGESKGTVAGPDFKKSVSDIIWTVNDSCSTVIGQGYSLMTPLMLAQLTSAFANEKAVVSPHLVKGIRYDNTNGTEYWSPDSLDITSDSDPLNPQILGIVHDTMLGAAKYRLSAVKDISDKYSIGLKTGTAENEGSIAHSWVTGFWGKGEERYVFTFFIENGEESLKNVSFMKEFFTSLEDNTILRERYLKE